MRSHPARVIAEPLIDAFLKDDNGSVREMYHASRRNAIPSPTGAARNYQPTADGLVVDNDMVILGKVLATARSLDAPAANATPRPSSSRVWHSVDWTHFRVTDEPIRDHRSHDSASVFETPGVESAIGAAHLQVL